MLNTVPETSVSPSRPRRIRHRGRGAQMMIYLGKLMRMFLYQNDWKVLPMAALIAGLVSMVIRKDFFMTMEGSLKGSFALTCVAIWNGCFNSIQVICRERNILKREHRAGLHISSYIFSHMIYQALLCLVQTGLTMFVLLQMKVRVPLDQGVITPWAVVDIGITVFLISYCADMLSLLISALSHNTTTAMTVMPFVLIFQLVFSGGIFNLPTWSQSLSQFTISNYGLKCIAAQSDYNSSPMVTAWNTLIKLKDNEIGGSVTVGQVLDFLSDKDNKLLNEYRDREIDASFTVGELAEILKGSQTVNSFLDEEIDATTTLGDAVQFLLTDESAASFRENDLGIATVGELLSSLSEAMKGTELESLRLGKKFTFRQVLEALDADRILTSFSDEKLGGTFTLGQVIDAAVTNPDLIARRDQAFSIKITVGKLMELVGEENLKNYIQTKTAQVSYVPAYEKTLDNIVNYWMVFVFFSLIYALLAIVCLEFIDKDRR